MPKDKHENNEYRRNYSIMSPEDVAAGKKSSWSELEITAPIRNLSPNLWQLQFLTALFLNDNNLTRIPPDISRLCNLRHLDVSSNKLRSLPAEMGDLVTLRELLLSNNGLRVLPNELGKLFQLQTLGLSGNPLPQEILNLNAEVNGTTKLLAYMLDNLSVCPAPPERQWIQLVPERPRHRSSGNFSVMCFNVLCDKYCTSQQYGYCPTWALNWDYRKTAIMKEILHYGADIVSLQEVETEQFHNFFLPQLKQDGYNGIFSPKSRARTMSEDDRKHVDGCAIFYRTTKFTMVKEFLTEFNQLAMANAQGSDDMLNRVMTKDNIGIAVLLELKDTGYIGYNGGQQVLVSNAHIHWDPEFRDVKLIQTVLLMHELQMILKQYIPGFHPHGGKNGTTPSKSIPIVLCGDLNSLPNSGVIEFLDNGRIPIDHCDFQEMQYQGFLSRLSNGSSKNGDTCGELTHGLRLKKAYDGDHQLPFSNLTYEFKGVIDYVYYSYDTLSPLGVLGSVNPDYISENKIIGWPHPHFPSDHQALLVEFEVYGTVPRFGFGQNSNHLSR
ncbi:CCR4-NOT transcription complex subunit 6-like [Nematostella vectensis]|uniref:CCR4-NOT transcription complex subunit 6-like n=1 Tax=Nematostella vectensis TaxID=45351 RepID=UPI0020771440|nr:CCR4-NOT transcription complex subunit 6-like [Nematostella vectensis]